MKHKIDIKYNNYSNNNYYNVFNTILRVLYMLYIASFGISIASMFVRVRFV